MFHMDINIEAVVRIMEKENLNKSGFARRIGVHRATISRVFKNKKAHDKVIAGIKREFPEYSLDYFYGLSVAQR